MNHFIKLDSGDNGTRRGKNIMSTLPTTNAFANNCWVLLLRGILAVLYFSAGGCPLIRRAGCAGDGVTHRRLRGYFRRGDDYSCAPFPRAATASWGLTLA